MSMQLTPMETVLVQIIEQDAVEAYFTDHTAEEIREMTARQLDAEDEAVMVDHLNRNFPKGWDHL